MSSDTSKLPISWNERTAIGVGLWILKWAVVLSLSFAGTLIVMTSLGVSAQLMGWSIGVADFGDNVTVKYQILLVWTLGATIVAFVAKLIVLIKRRKDHNLRWTEYPGHGLASGVLSRGLAYGAVAVVIAALRGLASDISQLKLREPPESTPCSIGCMYTTKKGRAGRSDLGEKGTCGASLTRNTGQR